MGWGYRTVSLTRLKLYNVVCHSSGSFSSYSWIRPKLTDRMDWLETVIQTVYNQPSWCLGSAITSCYILYYLFDVVKKPLIATKQNGKFAEFIEKNMPILKEKFWPTMWCIEPRAQTILAPFVRVSYISPVPYKREILVLKDGGEVCLDILEPKEGTCSTPNPPTVVMLPGLTGGSDSDYIKSFALKSSENGVRAIVFNQRGIGIRIKTPRTYCASNTEDLVEVIEHVRNKYENCLLGALGISMGGLLLGNYLSSEKGRKTPISCAMIVSAPWNVPLGIQSLEIPVVNYLLNMHLANCLKDIVRRIRPMLEEKEYAIDDVLKSKNIREFDSKFTAIQFGYKDVTDYYNHAAIHDKIHNVKIPVICLSSADDPFQPINGIPIDEANKMDNLCIIVTSRGGHIGFLEGMFPMSKEQYMLRIFSQYFKSMFFKGGLDHFSEEDYIMT